MTTSATTAKLGPRHAQERLPHVGVDQLLVLLRVLYTLVLVLAFAVVVGGAVGYGLTVALARLFDGG
jgi:hypothetical protein